ncbi:thioredoxin-like protein [Trichoderma ceciliae]
MPHSANSKFAFASRALSRALLGPKPGSCDTGSFEGICRVPLVVKRHQWTDLRSRFIYSGSTQPGQTLTLHQHRIRLHSTSTSNRHFSTMSSATNFFDFKVLDSVDTEVPLSTFKGKVVLVVNTASKCGFTYQYKNLESVYQDIKKEYPDDFTVIGFPCNQFGGQEPGSNEDIQNFCSLDQKVTFPVMGKIDVNGDGAHPLYKWLKKEKPGLLGLERVKWNFEKFLIGRDGKIVDRWASTTEPEKFQSKIIEEIKKPAP